MIATAFAFITINLLIQAVSSHRCGKMEERIRQLEIREQNAVAEIEAVKTRIYAMEVKSFQATF